LQACFNGSMTMENMVCMFFFVISGFVIPLSLLKGRYHINDYTRFLYKRVLRLHPPYLAALALTLIIMFLSYKARKVNFPENGVSIFKSIWYLHIPSDNPVFWTLAVEAQYYLFIGLFYILLTRYTKQSLFIGIPLLAIMS
jgi:peptidoglycan/LPS O-acetylase OafA/YrhL